MMVGELQDFLKGFLIVKKENENIRKAARVAGVPLYAVAFAVGISEPTLMRWMRLPLPPEKEQRIMEAISRLEMEESLNA